MRTILPTVTALLFAVTCQCFALQESMILTKEQAEKEFGIKVTSKAYPDYIHVWLEFKPHGKLKGFSHVDFEVLPDGKKSISARLMCDKSNDDTVTASFMTHRDYLPTSVLTIVVRESERTRIGYEIRVKDFIDLKP